MKTASKRCHNNDPTNIHLTNLLTLHILILNIFIYLYIYLYFHTKFWASVLGNISVIIVPSPKIMEQNSIKCMRE